MCAFITRHHHCTTIHLGLFFQAAAQHTVAVTEEAFQLCHSARGNVSACGRATHPNDESISHNLHLLRTETNLSVIL